jgi:hypothetical protein
MGNYSEYPIRDQDGETRRTLDLLQGWGSPGRKSFRARLGRALVALGKALQDAKPVRTSKLASALRCEVR